MRYFAQLISFLFHPVLFLLLTPFLIVYRETNNSLYALKWGAFSMFFIGFGIIAFFLGKWRGIFSDYDLTKKEEREKFYAVAAILAVSYFTIAFSFKGIFFPISIVALGIVLGIILLVFINLYIKASIHIAVITAFVITMEYLYDQNTFWTLFIIIPLLAWSRLILKRHTIPELIVGVLLGTGITIITFFAGKLLYAYAV